MVRRITITSPRLRSSRESKHDGANVPTLNFIVSPLNFTSTTNTYFIPIKIRRIKPMTKTLSLIASLALLGITLYADESSVIKEERNDLISLYGVNAKTSNLHDSQNGSGMFYNTEKLKVMMEGTSEFFKAGTVLKFNPFDDRLYFKVGGNYLNQKLYAPDSTNAKVNQYSGALGAGYMLDKDLYIELGGSTTRLNGKTIGTVYAIDSETTNRAYAEIAKRFDTSIGTFDTTLSGGRLYRGLGRDENNYGTGLDYYPTSNLKLGYYHAHSDSAVSNTYALSYGYLTASYSDNLSQNTHYASVGVQFAFTDITDISSYKMPTNIKPHLSELHAFEQMTFNANMNIQSTNGVHRTIAESDKSTVQTDNATTATAPTLDSASATTINTTAGSFTDTDGVRNVTVALYSDAGLTTLVATNANGDFTGLSASTTYYAITAGEAFNAATQTWETKRSAILSVTLPSVSLAGQSVIDLGTYGKLIAPVQVDGKWFYVWDMNGDGTHDLNQDASGQYSYDGSVANASGSGYQYDVATHNVFDPLFNHDSNGVTNTTVANIDGHFGTTNDYRFATLNGVNVALPTTGTGLANEGSAGYYLNDNQTYTDLAEIWDSSNTGYQTNGTPAGWRADYYWSATPSDNGHATVGTSIGYIFNDFDGSFTYVALQVL